jgi:hypothetical protein
MLAALAGLVHDATSFPRAEESHGVGQRGSLPGDTLGGDGTGQFYFTQGQITASLSPRPWDREDAASRTVPSLEHQSLS